ncbi:hypothetical protein OHA59_28755 [Streptomyces sp. NBC_01589]|uniref:hypothetical protein n=1 Tax=Streptomyces sp. NBC_01589 TaxID=2975886 RepID=UPI00386B039C
MGDTRVGDRDLAEDGTIRREGSLSRVPAAFAPLVEAARSRITDAFDAAQLQSAYLYGSIPRGTAIPGVSGLDLLLALHAEPTESDQAAARAVEAALDASFSRRHRGIRGDLRPVPLERIEQMRVAAATGRTPSTDPAVLTMLIDDLAPWPAAEYIAA